jgi:hypothetical protein
MSVVEDFQAYLEDASLIGGQTGWQSVRRRMLDDVDRIVCLTEDGGPEPETPAPEGSMGDAALSEPAFQVRVRADRHDSDMAFNMARQINDLLHGLLREQVNGTWYQRVKAQTTEPVFIGFDERGRPEFTQSFRAVRSTVQAS